MGQFRADFLRAAPPTTAEGIEKYLASGMIKGIGPIYAKKLVKAFKEQVFDVIEQTSQRLQDVDGIGPKRYPMLQRNLLYTAVTLGKRLVVIVGQRKANGSPE